MTIREKGYFHWDGSLREGRRPWWPITRLGLRLAFKKRGFKFLYFGTFVPALAFLVGIYISERIGEFRYWFRGSPLLFEVNPAFFKTYYTSEFLLFMLVMLMVVGGAGLIADDLRHNALQLYFSRPLEKRDYLAGKASVLVVLLLSLTLLPGLAFVLFKLLFSGSFSFIATYPWIMLSILAYSAAVTAFFCLYTLVLSSLEPEPAVCFDPAFCDLPGVRYPVWDFLWKFQRTRVCAAVPQGQPAADRCLPVSAKAALRSLCRSGRSCCLTAAGVAAWIVVNRRVRSVEVVK